ncbi:MAG: LPXTG cell wall anchor domain-containing protein [Oscillochloris sp.]|nr:LPXTG cell wall anchor domain-containing protein [Oscillochloris sp.]
MDRYTEVTRTGCLGNFFNSIVAALIGLALFIGAFPLIWFGEGRTNLAQVAATSLIVGPGQADAANEGKLIAVTGQLQASPLGDSPYLRPGAYLRLERTAEMYAWVEHEHTKTHDTTGGGTRTERTYTYSKEWTAHPESGEGFHVAQGHRNPAQPVTSARLSASEGQIGTYDLDLDQLELPSGDDLALTASMVGAESNARLIGSHYLFQGKGSLDTPTLGDVRISYQALPNGTSLTVFGAQHASQLIAYSTPKGDRLYRGLEGDRAAAIKQLQTEDTITDWIIRLAALLLMWAGLSMTLGPINAAVGILPIIRQAGGCLIGLVTLAVAVPIWAATVLVAIVAHNIWLMIAVALLVAGGAVVLLKRRKVLA